MSCVIEDGGKGTTLFVGSGCPISTLDKRGNRPMRFCSDTMRIGSSMDWESRIFMEDGARVVWQKSKVWWSDDR